jgi:hypothetical protein
MPSKILNTLTTNDNKFSVNFQVGNYDPSLNSLPILDIWTDFMVKLKQEEKQNSYLYLYHGTKRSDTLESISRAYYETGDYWWLILIANDSPNPFDFLDDMLAEDTTIKIIQNKFLSKILRNNGSSDIMNYLKGLNGGK